MKHQVCAVSELGNGGIPSVWKRARATGVPIPAIARRQHANSFLGADIAAQSALNLYNAAEKAYVRRTRAAHLREASPLARDKMIRAAGGSRRGVPMADVQVDASLQRGYHGVRKSGCWGIDSSHSVHAIVEAIA